MATKQNDALDDELVSDENSSFIGGQVSATAPDALAKNSYAEAQNMDFDNFGRLVTRRGARTTTGNNLNANWEDISDTWNGSTAYFGSSLSPSIQVEGCFFFDTGAGEYLVVAQNGTLYRGTESASFQAISGSSYSSGARRLYFAQLANRLYYCDGVNALRYVDSSLANNAITAGKVTSIKITDSGSGYNSAPAITFSHNGGSSGAATAVLGYGGRVVAATVTNQGSGYSATTPPTISFAAGTTTATGTVNISQVPSKAQMLVSHMNRLFCTSADTSIPTDTLYVSDILDGESWDLVGASLRIGGDGDPITGLFSWFGQYLLVFKERSIWRVKCDPLAEIADWEVALVNNRIGCLSHHTIQPVAGDVFFLANDGVRSLRQIESGTQTAVGLPLSAPIQDVIDSVNKAYIYRASSAYYRNRYFLSVITGGSNQNDTTLVYNALNGSWTGPWTGWRPTDLCVTGFSGKQRLTFSDYQGRVWTWDDFTSETDETSSQYRDDTSDYESFVVTRAYNCGDPLVEKLGYTLAVLMENRLPDTAVTGYIEYDKDESGSFTTLDNAVNLPASTRGIQKNFNLLSKGKWTGFQVKIGATRHKITVNAVAITGFADNLKPEL